MTVVMSHEKRRERAAEAKKRVEAGEKVIALAHEYGVEVSTVYRWVWGGQRSRPRKSPIKELAPAPVYRPQANSVFQLGAVQC